MLKGLYFMGWQRDMWNYHPSLPMKNMQMVEDITDIGADMLIWSCLGSGAIGLPYMDKEANEAIPPRMRLYGYMNDKEFCEECRKRGVKVFSVLWKAQLWEFGAEFNEDESELLALNIHRDVSDNRGYIGMSELSTNRYPKLFEPIEKYFPNGLLDYKGEPVTDFLKEFKSVSLEGRDIMSYWLMAPDHDHRCYTPCCNKDSFLRYLKRDVEMMIDAGAGGLHIDEYDTPKHVLHNAGCFCPECMHKFRLYLKEHQIPLPEDAGDVDSFDYREYLLKKGYKDENLLAFNLNDRWKIPLYRHFVDMEMSSIQWIVRELSTHAKAYAKKTRGEDFPVTANLFQCLPVSWNCKKYLDILAGEKTDIRLRQDGWYKFAFGWLNGKQCCFVEDPNQYVRDMVTDIKNGINDRFILFAMEPLAHGFHVAFPYGSWLQNQVKDAFWPDLRLLKKLGPWLKEKDRLFPRSPVADIAVYYDAVSAYENMWTEPGIGGTSTYNQIQPEHLDASVTELGRQGSFSGDGDFAPFFDLIQELAERHTLFNVLYGSPDEPLTRERLAEYKTVVIADAFLLDDATAKVLRDFASAGGSVITLGRAVEALKDLPNVPVESLKQLAGQLAEQPGLLTACDHDKLGIALHKTDNGYALHLVNYNFNQETHRIDSLPELSFQLHFPVHGVKVHPFPTEDTPTAALDGETLTVRNAGIYTIVELEA